MKKIIIAAILISTTFISFAQDHPQDNNDDKSTGGFKKENLFTGGGLDLSFSTYGTVLGAEPEFGYSINKWLDVGVVMNFIYSSVRLTDYYGNLTGDKYHQTNIGPGAFVRIYPVDFLFVQAQYENSFIRRTYIYGDGGPSDHLNTSAPSLLLGAGYCTGREGLGGEPFFWVSVSADVLGKYYSPYVLIDGGNNPVIIPIVKAGLQVPLFQNNKGSSQQRHRRDDY